MEASDDEGRVGLAIEPFHALTRAERAEVRAEADALLAVLARTHASREVRLAPAP